MIHLDLSAASGQLQRLPTKIPNPSTPGKPPLLSAIYRGPKNFIHITIIGVHFAEFPTGYVSKNKPSKIHRFYAISPGRGLWYSYKTCGGKDYWMTPEKKKELQVWKGSEQTIDTPAKKMGGFVQDDP